MGGRCCDGQRSVWPESRYTFPSCAPPPTVPLERAHTGHSSFSLEPHDERLRAIVPAAAAPRCFLPLVAAVVGSIVVMATDGSLTGGISADAEGVGRGGLDRSLANPPP